MGLMMLELAKRTGAASVDMVDLSPAAWRRPLASASRPRPRPGRTGPPQGWDLVIDATGNAAAIQDGLDRVAKAGTFLQFGVADYATRVQIDPSRIYNQEITITGSMAVLHSRARRNCRERRPRPGRLHQRPHPLDRYPEALEQLAAGVGRKIVAVVP